MKNTILQEVKKKKIFLGASANRFRSLWNHLLIKIPCVNEKDEFNYSGIFLRNVLMIVFDISMA